MKKEEFYKKAATFLDKVFDELSESSFKIKEHWDIDHICFRVETQDEYIKVTQLVSGLGELLAESPVNGRMISTYKLKTPIWYEDYIIELVEIPQPKEGSPKKSGFDHIELVVDEVLADLPSKFESEDWGLKGLEKTYNPELKLSLGETGIKLHNQSLESVICLENNTKVMSAINELNVLADLKEHQALVAGTFPLGMHTDDSDVDVLLKAQDLDALEVKLKEMYSSNVGYSSEQKEKSGLNSLIVKFQFQGVEFELFAQDHDTPTQVAFKHYQIEEKLLKYMGESFRQEVLDFRKSEGMKTEPAFAKALGEESDPYKFLAKLSLSPIELLEEL